VIYFQILTNAGAVLVRILAKIPLEVSAVDVLMATGCWTMACHALQPMVGSGQFS